MFKKIKYHTHENVGWGSISLPEQRDAHHRHAGSCLPAELVNRYDRDTLDGGLIGLARIARTTAALLLMSDPRDLGVLAQVQAPFTGRPTLYLYDAVPGGVGLTERLFTLVDELLRRLSRRGRVLHLRRWLPGLRGSRHRGRPARQADGRRAAGRDDLTDARPAIRSPSGSPLGRAPRQNSVALPPPEPPSMTRAARPGALVRRADSRSTEGGTALVVERALAVSPEGGAAALAPLPAAAYFDTETTGLSTGAGTVIFLAGVGSRRRPAPDRAPVPAARLPARARPCCARCGRPRPRPAAGHLQRACASTCRCWPLASPFHGLFREQAAIPPTARRPAPGRAAPLPPAARRRAAGGRGVAGCSACVARRDCPGSEVPLRYFGYLRGGSPDILAEVLDHNFQDVVSLALLEAEHPAAAAPAVGARARVLDPRGHGAGAAARRRGGRRAGAGRERRTPSPTTSVRGERTASRWPSRLLIAAGACRSVRRRCGRRYAASLGRRRRGLDRGGAHTRAPPRRPARRPGGSAGRDLASWTSPSRSAAAATSASWPEPACASTRGCAG